LTNKKAKGVRAKTRDLFKRKGSKLSVSRLLKEFKNGDTVQININSSSHSGLPFRRYQGITGKVVGKQGSAFRVSLKEGNAPRIIITTAAHLKQLQTTAKAVVAKELGK